MKINDIEVDDAAVLALLTDEQKTKLTEAKGEQDFILYKPEKGERFFYLGQLGNIGATHWNNSPFETTLWEAGYIAPDTPAGHFLLELIRDQHLAKVRLRRWIAANTTEKVDWGDYDQPKCFPVWAPEEEAICTDVYNSVMVNPDGICVASRDVECFLAECEDDLKIYFGVKA